MIKLLDILKEIEVLDPFYGQIPHDKSIPWVLYVKNKEEWQKKWAPILDRLGYKWVFGDELPSEYFSFNDPYIYNNYYEDEDGILRNGEEYEPDKESHFRKINFK